MWEFDQTFDFRSSQEEVYSEVSPLVTSVLDGYNVCIFAYGQTGSGKTFTMTGPEESKRTAAAAAGGASQVANLKVTNERRLIYIHWLPSEVIIAMIHDFKVFYPII